MPLQAPPPIFDHVYPTWDKIYDDFIEIIGEEARHKVKYSLYYLDQSERGSVFLTDATGGAHSQSPRTHLTLL